MMWYQQAQHQQSQTAPLSTVVPQFLDHNQQLVAHFNQQTGSGPFVEGLNVTDASQFVSVIQQQQNPHLQDGFNPATFFQQHHHSQSVTQHHHPTTHQHHPTSHQTHSHHHHHNQQHQQQQLTCANVISANATSSIDSLSLAGAGHVIIDPTTNGLLGLSNRASVVGDRTALVMNTINNLRHHQQPRANIASDSNINCNSNSNSNNHRDHTTLDECNLSVPKLAANNHNTNNSSGNHNNNIINNNGNINSNNHANSNQKSSNSKSKNNCSNKKDKLDNHRSSESPRRIFSCPTCCKGFTEKFNMKRHMQIHSQSRPKYICNECSKSFAWKDNFIRHKKAAHGSSPAQYPV